MLFIISSALTLNSINQCRRFKAASEKCKSFEYKLCRTDRIFISKDNRSIQSLFINVKSTLIFSKSIFIVFNHVKTARLQTIDEAVEDTLMAAWICFSRSFVKISWLFLILVPIHNQSLYSKGPSYGSV